MTNPTASARNRWAVLSVLAFSLLAVGVDVTVLNVAIPTLAQDLRPTSAQMLWIVNMYSLMVAGLLLSVGTLGDRLGRKRFLLAGFALFGGASALAAFSGSAEMLIFARGVLGVSAAVIMPSTLSILRNVFTDRKERTFALGVWTSVAGAGAAVGPLLAGFLLEHFWWGSVFLINVPLMGLAFMLGVWLLPESRDPDPPRWDVVGAFLSVSGLLALVYGIQQVSEDGLTATVMAAGLGGIALLFVLVVWLRRTDQPLIDLELFRDRTFAVAAGCLVITMFVMIGLMFLISQQLQIVMGYSPLGAGLRLIPLILGAIVGAPLVRLIVPRFGTRAALSIGLLVMAISLLALTDIGPDSGSLILTVLLVLGVGATVAMTAASDAVMSTASAERAGGAAGIEETSYQLGSGLGIAIMGSIAAAVYAGGLDPIAGVPPRTMEAAKESVAAAAAIAERFPPELANRLLHAAESAFVESFAFVALVSGLATAVLAVTVFLLVPRRAGIQGGAGESVGQSTHEQESADSAAGTSD